MKMETFFSFLKDAGFSTDRTENHVNAATGVSWRPPGACAGKRGERPEETPASEALGLSPPAGALGVCLPMRAQARPPGAQPAAGGRGWTGETCGQSPTEPRGLRASELRPRGWAEPEPARQGFPVKL